MLSALSFEGINFSPSIENRATRQISIHDNCFIKPEKGDLVRKIVDCVLEQHSFYLGQEIDWSEISPRLTEHLLISSKIGIQSDPKRRCVDPTVGRTKTSSWIPFSESFWPGQVVVESRQAHLRKRKAIV